MNERLSPREYWEKSQLTERPLEAYEKLLNLEIETLRSKIILDLGSGKNEEFARGLKDKGVEAEVVSVNPQLAVEEQEKDQTNHENAVAAIAQTLPFAKDSFDIILSLDAVPLYLPSDNMGEYKKAFFEIDRVLKPGGEVRIYPIQEFEKESKANEQSPLISVIEDLENRGYEIIWEEYNPSEQEMEKYKTVGGLRLIIKKPKNENPNKAF